MVSSGWVIMIDPIPTRFPISFLMVHPALTFDGIVQLLHGHITIFDTSPCITYEAFIPGSLSIAEHPSSLKTKIITPLYGATIHPHNTLAAVTGVAFPPSWTLDVDLVIDTRDGVLSPVPSLPAEPDYRAEHCFTLQGAVGGEISSRCFELHIVGPVHLMPWTVE